MKESSINLINGTFSREEAINLITELVEVKLRFHENRIDQHTNEEDIKQREKRIKELQNDLARLRLTLQEGKSTININGQIHCD